MKKYKIFIEESLSRVIEIEATDEVEALNFVKIKYKKEEIVLSADDFSHLEMNIINE